MVILLLYLFLQHVLALSVMIQQSYRYVDLVYLIIYTILSLLRLRSSLFILIGFTLLRENRGNHSTIPWLASVGSIIHCLHPSIAYLLVYHPDLLLDQWHGGLFPTVASVLDELPCLLCLGSELVTKLTYGELDFLVNSPQSLKLCWLNLKLLVLPSIQNLEKSNAISCMKEMPNENGHEK